MTYSCSCCNPAKTYSRSDKLSNHREKYDPTFVNYFAILRQLKEDSKASYYSQPNLCHCGATIPFEKREQEYCSRSCAATLNNQKRATLVNCVGCGTLLKGKQRKYCNQFCQGESERRNRILEWQNGITPSQSNGELSNWAKVYLKEQAGEKCSKCSWGEIHPVTGKVPLQVDHIDGDFRNNVLANLRVLCPNCHSLTPNYGALNKGNGRGYRYNNIQNNVSTDTI